jgi:polyhydroxyalkanoate synthase
MATKSKSAPSLGAPLDFALPEGMPALQIDPEQMQDIQKRYVAELAQIMEQGLKPAGEEAPMPVDRRFSNPAWHDHGVFEYTARLYLLNSRTMQQLAEAVQADDKTRARIRFAVGQWVDALSPANFLVTNPEAQKKMLDTNGESIKAGITNLMEDVKRGRISMTDESRFEVGVNVATTEGSVVYECEFFQLIQYKPLTAQVGTRPVLLVPPCINKFYVMDLQPSNSIVRYLSEEGMTTFMVSWRNPTQECSQWTWADYIEKGVIHAIEVASEIAKATTKADKINVLGFCVGGTLVSTALAVMAARGKKPAASLTLLTTLLDFTNTGVLDVFIDEKQVRKREDKMAKGGLMPALELGTTFSFLRPNDLVWPYVVGNYLKGEKPPAFDLLYWNADSTNLPGPMYCWYLRNTYLENLLKEPGACEVNGTPVDLSLIDCPVYVYGSREDHIVPWESAYASTQVLTGVSPSKLRFVLGASGHIAGVINPAKSGKRNYWVAGKGKAKTKATSRAAVFPENASEWFGNAESKAGSWWPDWSEWLHEQAGPEVPAPKKLGSTKYKPTEAAPGSYVKFRVV